MNQIKLLRERSGLSQVQLSAKSGISQPYLSDIENGNRSGTSETIQKIADALGVSVEELVRSKEEFADESIGCL